MGELGLVKPFGKIDTNSDWQSLVHNLFFLAFGVELDHQNHVEDDWTAKQPSGSVAVVSRQSSVNNIGLSDFCIVRAEVDLGGRPMAWPGQFK